MGKEQDAAYYDRIWSGGQGQKSWNQFGPRKRLWLATAKMCGNNPGLIVDLGCGAGHLAECLATKNPPAAYVGYDFSEVAIHMAKKKLLGHHLYTFEQRDLRKVVNGDTTPPGAIFVCLEVLEHIQDDLRIFQLIPEGAQLIFSVPTFDDPAHVRHFTTRDSVMHQYGPYVDFTRSTWRPIWRWHLFSATRKDQHEGNEIHQGSGGLFA